MAFLALLPGAAYTFAYERVVGTHSAGVADLLIRFFAASAVFLALYSGPALILYRHYIVSGDLRRGQVNWVAMEVFAVCYVLLPVLAGSLVGHGRSKGWRLLETAEVLVYAAASTRSPSFWQSAGRPGVDRPAVHKIGAIP